MEPTEEMLAWMRRQDHWMGILTILASAQLATSNAEKQQSVLTVGDLMDIIPPKPEVK